MWPELVLIFGSPVTLLSNTEPTFKKGSLIPSHKTCEPTSPESRDLSARLHIYSFQKLFILFLYGCVGSSLLVWLSSVSQCNGLVIWLSSQIRALQMPTLRTPPSMSRKPFIFICLQAFQSFSRLFNREIVSI